MMANFDSAATAHMGPDVRFLANAKPSTVGIEVYNTEVVTDNMEGIFTSHCVDGNLMDSRSKSSPDTKRPLSTRARFKFLHTIFGGGITNDNVGEFMSEYPEFADSAKLPKALLHPSGSRQLPPCHCCTRTHMRKENAPPASSKKPAPLEEVHLDLFTYPDDPRYDAFFIDRRTRACWHYVLSKKSDLPGRAQAFATPSHPLYGRSG